jgi:hypothetical protein
MAGAATYQLDWRGPLALLASGDNYYLNSTAASKPGIYMWAFEYQGGYLIYGAGLTTRPLASRIKEDLRSIRSGEWTVLDGPSAQRGIRQEFWHGMWATYNTPARQAERAARRVEIERAAEAMLGCMRVFLANLPPDKRVLGRVEAAIMSLLYACDSPMCDLPDKGMHLEPRRPNEPPLTMLSQAQVILHGMPSTFEA